MVEIKVAAHGDIADGDYKIFATEGREVGVFRIGERLFAWENHCPHAGGPICQGKVFPRVEEVLSDDKRSQGLKFSARRHIVCPWHGFEFDIETGAHPGDPNVRLRKIGVATREGFIYLQFPR